MRPPRQRRSDLGHSRELAYLLDNFLQTPPARTLSEICCKQPGNRGPIESEPTYRQELSFRVFDKIGVSSRVELVLCALTSPMANPIAELSGFGGRLAKISAFLTERESLKRHY